MDRMLLKPDLANSNPISKIPVEQQKFLESEKNVESQTAVRKCASPADSY